MKRIDVSHGWRLSRPGGLFDGFGDGPTAQTVDLPHDAMIHEKRSPDSANGPDSAWYDGGTYIYEKSLPVPAEWRDRTVLLEFEAVAQNAMVFVDGQYAGKRPYAYSGFKLPIGHLLRYGGESTIRVLAKTGMQQTSRWYSGTGILRPVRLWVGGETHLLPDGLRFTTECCSEKEALVTCSAAVGHTSQGRSACRIQFTLRDADGNVAAREDQPLTLFGRETARPSVRFHIPKPRLWNTDTPHLYTLTAVLTEDGVVLDEDSVQTGIRTITVDPVHGFRLNGRSLKLRGGCIHHDNGILGGVSLFEAEKRRVERMKAAGFNAIRSAHNPASRALLEACDQAGMLVMDELFDVWNESKRDHDYSLFFAEWWEKDMESIVEKDYNHPSVILYTLGNEIPETGTAAGAAQNRAMLGKFRTLDPTRPIANCINGMFSVMPHMRTILAEVLGNEIAELPTDINELMSMFDANIDEIMRHPIVAEATEETFAGLDVCGYNYMASRYALDAELYPNRVILGSETNPDKIGYNWPVIQSLPHVIGDFCWTGWDYIGEAGVGKNDYDMTHAMYGPWPWFLAYCGDFDICGNRRPQSYYREIVFGLRAAPYIAVERPDRHGIPKCTTNWTWPDVIESWTWHGQDGKPTTVEVYSDSEDVELLLNGTSIGRKLVGEVMPFKALFDVTYTPGTLTAVGYRDGAETGRMSLSTAGVPAAVALKAEREAAPADGTPVYVDVVVVDAEGNPVPCAVADVTLELEGDGVLLGFGSANPATTETFDGNTHSTFDGRALSVLAAGKPGTVVLRAYADKLDAGEVTVHFIETKGSIL